MSRPKSPGPSEPSSLLTSDHQMVKEEQIKPTLGAFPRIGCFPADPQGLTPCPLPAWWPDPTAPEG